MKEKRKLPQKMRSKILILCLISTMTALILQALLFGRTSSSLIYNQAKKESFSLLQNMQDDLFTLLKSVENNIIKVYNRQPLLRDLKAEMPVSELRSKYYREAYTIATENFDTPDGVVALYLYDKNDDIISTYRRAVTPKHNYPVDIYEDAALDNGARVLEYVHSDEATMLISSYYNPSRETDIVRFAMKIYNNSNLSQMTGYLVCDVDSKVFHYRMEKFLTDDHMFVWLQPMGDRAAVSAGNLDEKDTDTFQQISSKLSHGISDFKIPAGRESRVFFQVNQNRYNLSVYALMPQSLLVANQRSLTFNLMVIAVVMLVITLIATYFCSKSLTKPLEELTRTTERIKNGEKELRVLVKNEDEIGTLAKRFNEMLDQMEVLISREYETKLLLNRAEYNAMQAQINPHFLYNTLDTMSSIAQIRHCEEVSRLSQSLSNIFRYSLDMKNPFSTVSKEIVHLKNYIYVMNVRMQDNVVYEFDIDDEALKDTVPRICIQPLVENALNHGLRNVRGEKRVVISAVAKEDKLVIRVEDNGIGLDNASELNRIMEENNLDLVEKGNSIGLININARVKMLYGNCYGVRIESEAGAGARVSLTVARLTMEEVEQWKKKPIKY